MGQKKKIVDKAIILAGGRGTRLGDYSRVLPKPLMPIGDMPILELILAQIKHAGINDITLTVGYLSKLLRSYFGHGELFGVNISYSEEDKPLGTAGPLSLIDGLEDTFLVSNGDIFCNMNISDLLNYHAESQAVATISSYSRKINIDLGVMQLADNGNQVVDYIEKPKYDFLVSMGVYVFEPRVLEYIQKNQYFDFPDLVLKLIENKEKVVAFPFDGIWRDLGRPEDYEEANQIFGERRSEFLPEEK